MQNVLFIIPAMRGGGAEKVLLDILENIDYARYKVTLLVKVHDEILTHELPIHVELLWLWRGQSIWSHRLRKLTIKLGCYVPYYKYVCKSRLDKILKNRKFDTIVSFMEGEAVRMHELISHKAKRNVSWVHIDLHKKHWSSLWFHPGEEKSIYEMMNRVVFVSEDARRGFIEEFDYNKDNLEVIFNLIDSKKIVATVAQLPQIEKNSTTVCIVGRLNEQKRFDRAVKVVAKLRHEGYDVCLWIVGDGELREMLEILCKDLGVEDYVKFWGFVKPPYRLMKDADIYLSTSDSEGYPLTLCEALCLGKPCLCTAVTGPTEILGESEYGLLCDETEDSIYTKLKMLVESEDLRCKLTKKALERSDMFDVNKTMTEIYKVL